ncbi:MAG: hypothetical protein J0M20_07340 [Burkholderiales bacterium]|nr:hypothetical protein [Burkholderiales bacterium]
MSDRTLIRSALVAAVMAGACSLGHAAPFTLTGSCSVSSLVAGQGKCSLYVMASDNYVNPTMVRKGQIKVNGTLVHQWNNDASNPSEYSTLATDVGVSCGGTYTVTSWIVQPGATKYEQVGNMPALVCPAAP